MAPQHAAPTAVAAPPARRAPDARRPAVDGVAVCRRLLLALAADLGGPGAAGAPGTLGALAVRRSLAALAAERPPAPWRPVLQYRHHPRVHPAQFALAGLNAHVGHDLVLASVDACAALEWEPARLETAFDRLGDLLALAEERARDELLPGPEPLEITDPLAHLLGTWSPVRACDSAWSAARLLWRVREHPPLAAEFRTRLAGDTGLVGRCLLVPRR
ncbi:DUF5995 family protein [Streptomyces yaizuensis]|uniref:DUF5995 family protein n=1 Tax=Streptomyces yaizuensis TaxID=2989713 RepID=A0ABQ5P1R3_9ACTN|nr:DUF5995 family protein [Streptomyces sp. YSPA8]GLF96425.1 DUF5995 family protein [Streptomyces sp. YSPA8]